LLTFISRRILCGWCADRAPDGSTSAGVNHHEKFSRSEARPRSSQRLADRWSSAEGRHRTFAVEEISSPATATGCATSFYKFMIFGLAAEFKPSTVSVRVVHTQCASTLNGFYRASA